MLAEEYARVPMQRGRHQQRHQDRSRTDDEDDLGRAAPGTTHGPNCVTADRHQGQVRSGGQQGRREERRLPGHEDVERPMRIAPGRQGQERHEQGIHVAAGIPRRRAEAAQQLGLREEEQVVGEQPTHREHERCHRGAALARRVSIQLLQQHQAEQRAHQPAADQQCVVEIRVDSDRRQQQQRQGRRGEADDRHARQLQQGGGGHGPRQGDQYREPRRAAQCLQHCHGDRRYPQIRGFREQANGPQGRRGGRDDQAAPLATALPTDQQQYGEPAVGNGGDSKTDTANRIQRNSDLGKAAIGTRNELHSSE